MFLDTLRRLRSTERTEVSAAGTPSSQPPRTTLPRIQLPQFSGLYEDWPSFRDLFHYLIGKDDSAANVEKLHLKACLKGEAELLIRSLPTTGENFDRAWKVLMDYYENKRLLVRSYIARFLAIQRVKGESSTDLRNFYHGVVELALTPLGDGPPLRISASVNTPPRRWPLARITSVHPGDDGRVRVVTIRTATSELTRPIAKIILLPESRSDEQENEPMHGG
ncbi:uncharacterized protein LOC126855608 [Cataglyphis hispanica]|uniref:uncharacterized protein LOC126855608 n=1 Tax=Cataglyphis hispanica TaxID=1086592 RepID=UPI0021807A8E|nr:uncharacterized protein LOC126855608 [Cataglyphis hispanica]